MSQAWTPAPPSFLNVVTTITMSPAFLQGQVQWAGATACHDPQPGPKDWDPRRGVCGCAPRAESRDKFCKL